MAVFWSSCVAWNLSASCRQQAPGSDDQYGVDVPSWSVWGVDGDDAAAHASSGMTGCVAVRVITPTKVVVASVYLHTHSYMKTFIHQKSTR